MAIRIYDYIPAFEAYNLCKVEFYHHQIHTLVTNKCSVVDSWILETERIHRYCLGKLIVGLKVEWRGRYIENYPRNLIATLQLCVGHRCLIFHIIHRDHENIHALERLGIFLNNSLHTVVGVEIGSNVEKLTEDYGLRVSKMVDLRGLAAGRIRKRELSYVGLEGLAKEILQLNYKRPSVEILDRWDNTCLTHAQVKYACMDAFLSFEIGRVLCAAD